MTSWLLTSTSFRRRAFGKKRRRRRRKRNGSSGGEKAWSLLLLFPRRRLGARGSRRRGENHISIYTLYYSKEFVVVEFLFLCVWNGTFEIFFFLFTLFSLPQKHTHTHVRVTDTHTRVSSEFMCVSVRVCGVIVV